MTADIVNLNRVEAVEDHMLKLGQYEVPVGKSYQETFAKQNSTTCA